MDEAIVLVSQEVPSRVVRWVAAWSRPPNENLDKIWQGLDPMAVKWILTHECFFSIPPLATFRSEGATRETLPRWHEDWLGRRARPSKRS